MSESFHIIIPSRLGSTRLPRKPLLEIAGKPMILHVLDRAIEAAMGPVTVACDSAEIASVVTAAGGHAVLTDPDLPSGSDRVWQALEHILAAGAAKPDVVINLQGDEPLLPVDMLRACRTPFYQSWVDVVTFAHPIYEEADKHNPNMVKVVATSQHQALYFSRALIPYGAQVAQRHIGLYAYRYDALRQFVQTPPSALEQLEKLEQLRGLELGLKYYVGHAAAAPIGVDTPEDLAKVRAILESA